MTSTSSTNDDSEERRVFDSEERRVLQRLFACLSRSEEEKALLVDTVLYQARFQVRDLVIMCESVGTSMAADYTVQWLNSFTFKVPHLSKLEQALIASRIPFVGLRLCSGGLSWSYTYRFDFNAVWKSPECSEKEDKEWTRIQWS